MLETNMEWVLIHVHAHAYIHIYILYIDGGSFMVCCKFLMRYFDII